MNLKDKKGSITIFVLVGVLFISAFLIISFASNVNKSKIAKEQFDIVSKLLNRDDVDIKIIRNDLKKYIIDKIIDKTFFITIFLSKFLCELQFSITKRHKKIHILSLSPHHFCVKKDYFD